MATPIKRVSKEHSKNNIVDNAENGTYILILECQKRYNQSSFIVIGVIMWNRSENSREKKLQTFTCLVQAIFKCLVMKAADL